MTPASYSFRVQRGNNGTMSFRPANPDGTAFDHTGSTWFMTIRDLKDQIYLDLTGVVDGDGFVTFTMTPAQTRDLPVAPRYEIERRVGGLEETWLEGKIIASGGVNSDAP